jgi:hypothetical protein
VLESVHLGCGERTELAVKLRVVYEHQIRVHGKKRLLFV